MKYLKIFAVVMILMGLGGCDSSKKFVDDTTEEPIIVDETVVTPSKLVIGTDKVAVQSDGSDSALITVTALDSNNVLIPDANIEFSAPSGQLDASLVTTGTDGKASVNFSASAADPTNQTVTITASVGTAVSASVPVQVVGSTVQYDTSTVSQLTVGGTDTGTVTLLVADSSGNAVYNVPVTINIDPASSAAGQLDPTGSASQTYTANTDVGGKLSVDVKGLSAGELIITASALGDTATQTVTVVTSTTALQITSPADLSAHEVSAVTAVTITVPSTVSNVTLSTTLGQWDTVNGVAVNSNSYTANGVGGTTINATLSSLETGTSSVYVFDSDNHVVSDGIKVVFVNTTVDANSIITLQASANTVPVSVGDTVYSVTLTGRVTDASNNAIADAPVSLTMLNQPGGGEYLYPPYVFSDSSGVFQTTFYSGSIGSDSSGVDIVATLEGNGKTASANIIISQTAASVVIDDGTTVSSINSNTAYQLPISVQVADANGSPVPDATVSLRVWPKRYFTGYWDIDNKIIYTGAFENEDINRNLILDPGEEKSFVEGNYDVYVAPNFYNADLNGDGDGFDTIGGDGKLTPPNTAAGTLPTSVTTDANGVGTFDLIYLKGNALWVTAEITATVQVQGTESTGVLTFTLPALKTDISGGLLDNSPFNYTSDVSFSPDTIGMGGAGVGVMASNELVAVSTQSTITVSVVDATLQPISGANVDIGFLSINTQGTTAPTLDKTVITTGANGTGTATYTAGDQAGLDVIVVRYNDGTMLYSNYIRINAE